MSIFALIIIHTAVNGKIILGDQENRQDQKGLYMPVASYGIPVGKELHPNGLIKP